MSKEMNITDPSFREVCNNEIKNKLRAVLKNRNDKLVSTYVCTGKKAWQIVSCN
jgi:hypothetical protein